MSMFLKFHQCQQTAGRSMEFQRIVLFLLGVMVLTIFPSAAYGELEDDTRLPSGLTNLPVARPRGSVPGPELPSPQSSPQSPLTRRLTS